uniref:Uncharacterized protein n=1 Tax=Romanomermis culicivorax TaxID=13658 RepID=A0A915JXB6_ROMCU
MNPELYKCLTNRMADFYCPGNSLAAIVQHLFSVHLGKGFQGQGLAWAKRPLPFNALGYAALDAIAHFGRYRPLRHLL